MKTRKHTEDCMDANDDTSVLKGECICSKPQHTPTPWRETEGSRDSEFNYIVGHKTQVICEIDISHPEQQSNATFIVRAVNSHEALLEAAKVALEQLGKLPGSAQIGINPKACDLLQQAIAKAEGK